MAKAKKEGYLSSRESRRISRENRKITNEYEKKRKRKNVPETEYLTEMRDPSNAVQARKPCRIRNRQHSTHLYRLSVDLLQNNRVR